MNPMKISGCWDEGYVLDWHVKESKFIGNNVYGHPQFDTTRTEIGEALHQLKYRNDFSKIFPLASAAATFIRNKFDLVSHIVPMPPSKEGTRQIVTELAQEVSRQLGKPCVENLLIKTKETRLMKDIASKEEKDTALSSCFEFRDVLNDDVNNILILDDLYSTGSSLNAATQALRKYHKISQIFVLALSRTK